MFKRKENLCLPTLISAQEGANPAAHVISFWCRGEMCRAGPVL